jgi:hypothetical protein
MKRMTHWHSTRDFRTVSRPNGKWVAQKRGPGEGTKTFDPWIDLQGETESFELAKSHMELTADGFLHA